MTIRGPRAAGRDGGEVEQSLSSLSRRERHVPGRRPSRSDLGWPGGRPAVDSSHLPAAPGRDARPANRCIPLIDFMAQRECRVLSFVTLLEEVSVEGRGVP